MEAKKKLCFEIVNLFDMVEHKVITFDKAKDDVRLLIEYCNVNQHVIPIAAKPQPTDKEKKPSILSHIICFFFGHKPTSMLVETKSAIFTRGCSRCGCSLGFPTRWKLNIPPPRCTPKQLEEWNEFFEQQNQAVRDSVKRS